MRVIAIGTLGSALAQAQTRFVVQRLKENWPEAEFRVRTVDASGQGSVALQEALLQRKIDIAVHTLKHVPTKLVEGLHVIAVPQRTEPREALVGRGKRLEDLSEGVVLGVNTLRRQSQLLAQRPDLIFKTVSTDLEERLAGVAAGDMDAFVVGASELLRLDLRGRMDQLISPEVLLPAAGQGALGLEVRQGDSWAEELAYSLNHRVSMARVTAERAFIAALEAGDQCAAGALAVETDGTLVLQGVVCSPDGKQYMRAEIEGDPLEAAELGQDLARDLLEEGAADLLRVTA
jgi:hydroxymethylbilane synthase